MRTTDLKERLAFANRMPAPDRWDEIEHREPRTPIKTGPSPARRVAIAAFALTIAAATMGFTIRVFQRASEPAVQSPSLAVTNGDLYFAVGGGESGTRFEAVSPDGTNQRTTLAVHDQNLSWPQFGDVAWSPDFTRIAFVSALGGHTGLFTADADGSHIVRRSNDPTASWPSWSPDGRKIAYSAAPSATTGDCSPGDFLAGGALCPSDIYVMNADGSGIRRLTNDAEPEFGPVWSPDGKQIAFTRQGRGDGLATTVDVMNTDGSGFREIAATPLGSDFRPSWSPDGSSLVYASLRNQDWGIYVTDLASGQERGLIEHAADSRDNPVWSPDGTKIAYSSGYVDLMVMNKDGSESHRIARDPNDVGVGDITWRAEAAPSGPSTSPPDQVWATLGQGWTRLPEPPVVRSATAEVWDGHELLVWGGTVGGSNVASADGYALDPTTGTWRSLPPAPIARYRASAVWTGTEAIFWGGLDDQRGAVDGAAYDPATDSWRNIPAAPLAPRDGAAMVWTGQKVFVWGGGDESTANQGALYDPETDAWRMLSSTPFGLNLFSAVWSGKEVIVFGSYVGAQNNAASPHPVGLSYDPALNTWGEIPQAKGLSPQATSAGWLAGELIAYDYALNAASFDPATRRWSDLAPLPGRRRSVIRTQGRSEARSSLGTAAVSSRSRTRVSGPRSTVGQPTKPSKPTRGPTSSGSSLPSRAAAT